jgi:hypothetical protein
MIIMIIMIIICDEFSMALSSSMSRFAAMSSAGTILIASLSTVRSSFSFSLSTYFCIMFYKSKTIVLMVKVPVGGYPFEDCALSKTTMCSLNLSRPNQIS